MVTIVIRIIAHLILLCALCLCGLIYYYIQDLPQYSELGKYNPPAVTRIYSADGKLIEEYAKEYRVFVPIANIPLMLQQAFIAAEDKNFYDHTGIDFIGLIRAAVHNIGNIIKRKRFEGASTITQQVVKIFLVGSNRSIERKIKEAIVSVLISYKFTKNQILELYLNHVFLGNNAYGVAAAAKKYFNKSLDDLNLQEIAFIAGMPKAPSAFNPETNPARSKERRNYVLNRMSEDGYVSPELAFAASKKDIELFKKKAEDFFDAGYYAEHVRLELIKRFGKDFFYTGGLTVITALDSQYQQMAEKSLIEGIREYDAKLGYRGPMTTISTQNWCDNLQKLKINKLLEYEPGVVLETKGSLKIGLKKCETTSVRNVFNYKFKHGDVVALIKIGNHFEIRQIPEVDGATIAIEPSTGKVLAMVSGYDHKSSKFDRVVSAKRQSGSLAKPFVYLAALEQGIEPNQQFQDMPIEIEYEKDKIWQPKNFMGNYLGTITMRSGLEKSRNLVTVRVAQRVGLSKVAEVMKRFGVNQSPRPVYSMVLGSLETSLLEMTLAYSSIANSCRQVEPVFIQMVKDRNGRIIYRSDKRICQNCMFDNETIGNNQPYITPITQAQLTDPQSCYQLTSMLCGVVSRGTGSGASSLGKLIAGKTGTTNNSMDTWFEGFTPDIAVGVYIGHDIPKSLGSKATGGSVALPVFTKFIQRAIDNKRDIFTPFKIPEGIEFAQVDRVSGEYCQQCPGAITEVFKAWGKNGPPSPFDQSNEPHQIDQGMFEKIEHHKTDYPEQLPPHPASTNNNQDINLDGVY